MSLPTTAPVWVRNAPGAASFAFIIEPLDANTCYAFRITQHVSPLTAEDRTKLRDTLTKQFQPLIIQAFADRTFDQPEEDAVEQELRNLAKETIKRQFIACLADGAIELSSNETRQIATETLRAARDEATAKQNLADAERNVLQALCVTGCDPETKEWVTALPGTLAALLNDPGRLTAGSAVV